MAGMTGMKDMKDMKERKRDPRNTKGASEPSPQGLRFAIIALLILGTGGLIIGLSFIKPGSAETPLVIQSVAPSATRILQRGSTPLSPGTFLNSSPFSSTSPTTQPATTPAPWTYNATTNQHWDPTPGHNHWHSGPPPANQVAAAAQTGTPTPAGTPAAWEYNATTNKHWDPTHNHWHSGPAPAANQR